MSIARWNCIAPNASVLNSLPPGGGNIVFEHEFGTAAPAVNSWIGFLPKYFKDYAITNLKISVPLLDNNGTPTIRFKVGIIDTDANALRTGDNNVFAGIQTAIPAGATPVVQTVYVNGVSTGGVQDFTAGIYGNGSEINIWMPDLVEYTVPFDRIGNFSNFNVGIVCTAAAATWVPTDGSPKKMYVAMSLAPRNPRG